MIKGEVSSPGRGLTAIAIVIAPSEKQAIEHAKTVLKPYYKEYPQRISFSPAQSILSPDTKTVFLCTVDNGQINEENLLGFCKIASEPGSCIYYPCCKPSDRGEHCRTGNCRNCDYRKCKPNPEGKININDVPCGYGTGCGGCD